MRSTLVSELFPMTLYFIDDEESFAKIIKRFKIDTEEDKKLFTYYPPEGCAHTIALDTDDGLVTLVTLGEQETEQRAQSVIIHESVHVWQFVKKAVREKHPGIETEAYSIQYFATWMIKARDKHQYKRLQAAVKKEDGQIKAN